MMRRLWSALRSGALSITDGSCFEVYAKPLPTGSARSVMAVVVGFLVISFAIWGIGDIFRGFGRSTVAKIGRTEITIEQFRSLYNERLQQSARQLGRPISSGSGARDGLGPAGGRTAHLRDRARRARPRAGSRPLRRRGRQADHHRPCLPGPERPVRPFPVRADHPQRRLHRGALRRRAAPRLLRRQLAGTIVGNERAEGSGRGGQPLPERAALDRICAPRPRPGRRNSRARRRRCSPSITRSARSCSARPNTASS